MTIIDDHIRISKNILDKIKYYSEVFIAKSTTLKINVRDQKVESIDKGTTIDISLRVIKDKKLGFAFSNGGDIDFLIEQAQMNASFMEMDEFNILPKKELADADLDIYDQEINKISLEEKIEKTRQIESFAYKYDPRILKTENVSYFESENLIHIANSNGISSSYKSNHCGGYAQIICEDGGEMEEGFAVDASLKWRDFDPKHIGEEAAILAISLFGGKIIKSGSMPVILDSLVASEFLQIIAHVLSAEEIQKGKSNFTRKKGKVVAGESISIIDDGLLEGGLQSVPFDDEGVPSKTNYLIKEGVLNNYLYNTYSALKDRTSSTGSAKRISSKSLPGIGSTNFYLVPHKETPDKLIDKVEKGVYITRVMAMHSVNPISGDFSVGASGIMIENGKKTHPVRGITIAGNIYEMLKIIDGIGNDLKFHVMSGNCGSPTLLIRNLSIGGE